MLVSSSFSETFSAVYGSSSAGFEWNFAFFLAVPFFCYLPFHLRFCQVLLLPQSCWEGFGRPIFLRLFVWLACIPFPEKCKAAVRLLGQLCFSKVLCGYPSKQSLSVFSVVETFGCYCDILNKKWSDEKRYNEMLNISL